MDSEINLKEIVKFMWRGKYFILAVTAVFALAASCYVFFLMAPAYRYSSFLDLSLYQVESKDVVILIKQNQVVPKSLKDTVENSDHLVQSMEIRTLSDNDSMLEIGVEYTDPEVCFNSVKQTGLGIIEAVSNHSAKQMKSEEERNKKLLSHLDKVTSEYLLTRDEQIEELLEDDPIYRRLLEEKAECLVQLELLNFDLGELDQISVTDADNWVKSLEEKAQPVSRNKKTYIAIAVIFGFMLSLFILSLRHYFAKQDITDSCGE